MCNVVQLWDGATAIICGPPTDHTCDEKAIVYETKEGERFYFNNPDEERRWHNEHYREVIMGSVACSHCGRAAFDNHRTLW